MEAKRYIHKKSKRLCHTCGSWEYYDKYYCGHGAFVCPSCVAIEKVVEGGEEK